MYFREYRNLHWITVIGIYILIGWQNERLIVSIKQVYENVNLITNATVKHLESIMNSEYLNISYIK